MTKTTERACTFIDMLIRMATVLPWYNTTAMRISGLHCAEKKYGKSGQGEYNDVMSRTTRTSENAGEAR